MELLLEIKIIKEKRVMSTIPTGRGFFTLVNIINVIIHPLTFRAYLIDRSESRVYLVALFLSRFIVVGLSENIRYSDRAYLWYIVLTGLLRYRVKGISKVSKHAITHAWFYLKFGRLRLWDFIFLLRADYRTFVMFKIDILSVNALTSEAASAHTGSYIHSWTLVY